MKGLLVLFLAILAVLIVYPAVSAEILISPVKPVYNINDAISAGISLKESHAVSGGILAASVICPSDSKNFYTNGDITLKANEQQEFNAVWSKISNVFGRCYVRADFDSETSKSSEFLVTDRIDVALELDGYQVKPSQNLLINGSAIKANSMPAEGSAKITISGIAESQYIAVTNGNFAAKISLPANTPAGEYSAEALVFEKNDKGTITNRGLAQKKFSILSVPSMLALSIDDDKLLPNKSLIVKATLYDQASAVMKEIINVKIKSKSLLFDRQALSGESFEYNPAEATPGEWQIEASVFDLNAKRIIYVAPHEVIDISINGSTLAVRNTGNILYKGQVEARVTDKTGNMQVIAKQVSIAVGGEAKLQLFASEGIYEVEVNSKKFNNVPLTGAVSASLRLDNQENFNNLPIMPILLFAFILGILLFILNKSGRTIKSGNYPSPVRISLPAEKISDEMTIVPQPAQIAYNSRIAEPSLVIQGQKQKTSVLYYRTKNISELRGKISELSIESLVKFSERTAVNAIESSGGAVHAVSSQEIIGIFSPMTRQFRHESSAVKAAVKIDLELKANNRKLKAKLDYGIGISSGELALNINRKKVLEYTSIGKTISVSRKLAEKASQGIIISKDVYSRVMNEIKARGAGTIMAGEDEIGCYSVEGVTGSREAYSSYVRDVLRRIK
mgnify:CR=1 FL=1